MSAQAEQKSFDAPDETRSFERGAMHLLKIGGAEIGMLVLQPGWRWSKPRQAARLHRALRGAALPVPRPGNPARRDGRRPEFDAGPGDVTALPGRPRRLGGGRRARHRRGLVRRQQLRPLNPRPARPRPSARPPRRRRPPLPSAPSPPRSPPPIPSARRPQATTLDTTRSRKSPESDAEMAHSYPMSQAGGRTAARAAGGRTAARAAGGRAAGAGFGRTDGGAGGGRTGGGRGPRADGRRGRTSGGRDGGPPAGGATAAHTRAAGGGRRALRGTPSAG